MAVRFAPAAAFNAVGVFAVVIDKTADVDLTLTDGQTGGYCARWLLIGSTAGNIKFKDMDGNTCTQAVAANQRLDVGVQYIFSTGNGSTATTVTALG
jgi:hypothetical protein